MVYVFLAKGFEELEALAPVDVLRRAGIEVKTVGVTGKTVSGSHGIAVKSDIYVDEAVFDELEGIILPGGMPGTVNLEENETVQKFIDYAVNNNKLIGAICAAPSILGHKGLLHGKNVTCYIGYEKDLAGAHIIDCPAVRDGNIITGWGAGGAVDFALLYLEALTDTDVIAKKTARSMRYGSY